MQLTRFVNKSLLINPKFSKALYNNALMGSKNACRMYAKDRYNQDEESKKYEKDISDMINQVNQELLEERMEVNNKFLKQQEQAELELEDRKKNTFNKYTTYIGSEGKGNISTGFQPDRSKSDAYKKELLKKSMNYKLWVLSGFILVAVIGGNDIYNYFSNQTKFVDMNDNIREIQLKKTNKKQEKLNRTVKKLNKVLQNDSIPMILWNNGDFNAISMGNFQKGDIVDIVEDSTNKELYIVNKEGDLYRYNLEKNNSKLILKGHNLTEVQISNNKLYLHNKKKQVEILPMDDNLFDSLKIKRFWFMPWVTYTSYDKKMTGVDGNDMIFVKFDLGESHFLGETFDGKIYSACTLSFDQQNENLTEFNKGQYGLPEYPPSKLVSFAKVQKADIEEYPSDDNLNNNLGSEGLFDENAYLNEDRALEIELLTSSFFEKSGSVMKRKIVKFSAGKNHSYFIDSTGALLTFGDNSVGQIYLQKIGSMKGYPIVSQRLPNNVKCIDTKCIEDNSYFVVSDSKNKHLLLACGSGVAGELGNGQFKINQADATKVIGLSDLKYDHIDTVGGNKDKRFAILSQEGRNEKILMFWGNNKNGELPGLMQGKRFNSLQKTQIRLPSNARVLVTENFGSILF
ncbi:hypothetical protein QEN19_000388 [Hanseniaspora menglaensis]